MSSEIQWRKHVVCSRRRRRRRRVETRESSCVQQRNSGDNLVNSAATRNVSDSAPTMNSKPSEESALGRDIKQEFTDTGQNDASLQSLSSLSVDVDLSEHKYPKFPTGCGEELGSCSTALKQVETNFGKLQYDCITRI